jgi:beta-mannosidase
VGGDTNSGNGSSSFKSHSGEPRAAAKPEVATAYDDISLDGAWSVKPLPLEAGGITGYVQLKAEQEEGIAARVPGEIHLDLMRVGRMEDPDISDNARTRCRWPEEFSWWYRREFMVPAEFRAHLRQVLVFDGIDLFGQVFVNGVLVGSTNNAFASVEFDLREHLLEGVNELVVRVTSGMELPPKFVVPMPEEGFKALSPIYQVRALEALHGSQRKPRCAYGTDFCDPLPNVGIWRSVRLIGRSKVVIHHLRLDTVIRAGRVSLEGEIAVENLHPWSEISGVLELRLESPEGTYMLRQIPLDAQVGRSRVPCSWEIPEAQLWWPNGMGGQPLYRLSARVICRGEQTDDVVQVLGLRTVELDCSPLPQGRRFGIKINGQKVFCKGGNWLPTDLILARTDAARYKRLVSEAKTANFNMLRVNGDSVYEDDCFYEACDRAGILVWQDFNFSDTRYRDWDEELLELVRSEAEGLIRRIRHHASLALWCGNNECQYLIGKIWKADPLRAEEIGGTQIYNEILPDLCRFYDPARPYWPGSPSGGTDLNSEIAGDFHGLGDDPTLGLRFERWRELADESRARFVSESYAIGPPNLASIKQYLHPEELSLQSTGWMIHTNEAERGATAAGIRYHYGDPQGLSVQQFILYGQMYQALIDANVMEALRFRKNDPVDDCQGILVWSYNDTWGEVGWSIIDHYLRRKASYYWLKRAAEPVKVIVRSAGGYLVTRVINDTLNAHEATVSCGWMRVDGTAVAMEEHVVSVASNGTVEVSRVAIPTPAERDPRLWLYAATLRGDSLSPDQAVWPLLPYRELAVTAPKITVQIKSNVLMVSSPVYCHAVHLDDQGAEVIADNYFDLLPNVPQRILIKQHSPTSKFLFNTVLPIRPSI